MTKEAVPEFTFIIGADGKSTGKFAQGEYPARLTVNPAKVPKTMDNLHESGASKGKTQYAVYELEGDKLTVCITAPGRPESDRPKDFNTKGTANPRVHLRAGQREQVAWISPETERCGFLVINTEAQSFSFASESLSATGTLPGVKNTSTRESYGVTHLL